jgi:hypothetical protein
MGIWTSAGSFGNSNETSNSIKCAKFIDSPGDNTLLNKKKKNKFAPRVYKLNVVFNMDYENP